MTYSKQALLCGLKGCNRPKSYHGRNGIHHAWQPLISSSSDIYPNIKDLTGQFPLLIPSELLERLEARYEGGMRDYITDKRHGGRWINACMYKDSLADAEEEIVDALFNLMVHRLKNLSGVGPNWATVAQGVLDIWYILQEERQWEATQQSTAKKVSGDLLLSGS